MGIKRAAFRYGYTRRVLKGQKRQFELDAVMHLNSAYNLSRWLVRDESVAQDMVQEAYLRAHRYQDSFRGNDMRPWLLSIVRNTCFSWLQENHQKRDEVEFDEERDSGQTDLFGEAINNNPEAVFMRKQASQNLNEAIGSLPPLFREVLILRELEEMSYEDIAVVAVIPIGTVMSRLSRARSLLRNILNPRLGGETEL